MSFGKNPHVVKAETAEQKARDARDEIARVQAWLEAAHRWERAAERETDSKRRQLYTDRCAQAREQAIQRPEASDGVGELDGALQPAESLPSAANKPKHTLLN